MKRSPTRNEVFKVKSSSMVEDTSWGEGEEVGQCGKKVIYPPAASPLRTRFSLDRDTIRTGAQSTLRNMV